MKTLFLNVTSYIVALSVAKYLKEKMPGEEHLILSYRRSRAASLTPRSVIGSSDKRYYICRDRKSAVINATRV